MMRHIVHINFLLLYFQPGHHAFYLLNGEFRFPFHDFHIHNLDIWKFLFNFRSTPQTNKTNYNNKNNKREIVSVIIRRRWNSSGRKIKLHATHCLCRKFRTRKKNTQHNNVSSSVDRNTCCFTVLPCYFSVSLSLSYSLSFDLVNRLAEMNWVIK